MDARKDVLQGNVNVSKLLSNALPFVLVMENAKPVQLLTVNNNSYSSSFTQ